jgi:hypothetical protein
MTPLRLTSEQLAEQTAFLRAQTERLRDWSAAVCKAAAEVQVQALRVHAKCLARQTPPPPHAG